MFEKFLKLISFYTHLPAYEDGTECSETSAYKLQTPGNYPEESIQQLCFCFVLGLDLIIAEFERFVLSDGSVCDLIYVQTGISYVHVISTRLYFVR